MGSYQTFVLLPTNECYAIVMRSTFYVSPRPLIPFKRSLWRNVASVKLAQCLTEARVCVRNLINNGATRPERGPRSKHKARGTVGGWPRPGPKRGYRCTSAYCIRSYVYCVRSYVRRLVYALGEGRGDAMRRERGEHYNSLHQGM